jgi:uncharacterized protein (UPF0248 family)
MTPSHDHRQPPIHEVLSRIRWDPTFGRGRFELGYWDRVCRKVVRVPLARVHADPDDRYSLRLMDAAGGIVSLPYHRVVAVWRDGELIWQRHTPQPP